MTPTIRRRLASIDAFRALTMFFMIFVNDLVLDVKIPDWLEHAREGEDRLGFADTIFPAFLFIVGLSIPLAIRYGKERGFSNGKTVWNILRRSFALLVMGFFLVNYEEFRTPAPGFIGQFGFLLIITVAFFFVWLVYPETWPVWKTWLFRGIGIAALVWMAAIYKGGSIDHPMGLRPHWWGILGLIGWAYLSCAILYFLIGDRLWLLGVFALYFLGVSIAAYAPWGKGLKLHDLTLGGSGGLSAFTMAGVMTTVFYRRMTEKGKVQKSLLVLTAWVAVLIVAGFLLRPFGGIAKLGDTPSWILICTGISVACVVILAYVVDIKNKQSWYRLLKPAGTVTLTCYLLPDIHFAILKLLGESWRVPEFLRTEWIGVGKSLIFAFLIVLLTGLLEKKKIRLSV
jgi:heparan-alpha-glucosaminide N-acetyltransferase